MLVAARHVSPPEKRSPATRSSAEKSPASAPPVAADSSVSAFARGSDAVVRGVAIAAGETGQRLAHALANPKLVALLGGEAALMIAGAFVPTLGEAAGAVLGSLGVEQFVAHAHDHAAACRSAATELGAFTHELADDAGSVDVAARHFATFLETAGGELLQTALTAWGASGVKPDAAALERSVAGSVA